MLQQYLTTSTENPADSSIGVFRKSFIRQWDPALSRLQHETHGLEALAFGWAHEAGGTMVAADRPADESEARILQTRVISHFLVDSMPDSVLEGLFEEIVRAWEDYQISLSRPALEPATTRRVNVRVRNRFERPTFEIVEE